MRKAKHEIDYWRVTIVYKDGEASANRVFNDLDRAKAMLHGFYEPWLARAAA